MGEDRKRIGDLDIVLKTFKTNLIVLKEIGADVRIIPRKKKLHNIWRIANGFAGFGFIPPKWAEKQLRKNFGDPEIKIDARYFGPTSGVPNPIEVEGPPQAKRCESFFCRVRLRAFGFNIKVDNAGNLGGSPFVEITVKRVTATATVKIGTERVSLSVS